MVVEQRHGYVWVLSVRESQICARRIVAPVQRASSIAVDERGNMFIHDLQSASVRLLDSNFNIIREVCLVSALCPMISARKGFLLVTDTRDNVIRAYKYKVP
ncbi:hypothetical protein AB6A40_008027 [Gnathostoma spinigerum]|uniref:Uncharacterized protein n=1 Tax=Gnathostoma spinigerum TaxID=75299 RepID=A0ABD6EN75_9BILA